MQLCSKRAQLNSSKRAAVPGSRIVAAAGVFAMLSVPTIGYAQEQVAAPQGESDVQQKVPAKQQSTAQTPPHVASSEPAKPDVQLEEIVVTAQDFPRTGAFGPWLVTADEISSPSMLSVMSRLNGTVVQSQPTSDMIFPIPEIIAYASRFRPLSPGDVIVTATPGSVGAKCGPRLWMKQGYLIEVDIPAVGILNNRVVAEHSAHLS